jgi:hypothetical protein
MQSCEFQAGLALLLIELINNFCFYCMRVNTEFVLNCLPGYWRPRIS